VSLEAGATTLEPQDFSNVKPGDILTRIFGSGFMESKMRVSAVDDKFIYCDKQNDLVLPAGSEPWKFDKTYGVETDEEEGWGIAYSKVLSRIVP
jgi:hypothetical protein